MKRNIFIIIIVLMFAIIESIMFNCGASIATTCTWGTYSSTEFYTPNSDNPNASTSTTIDASHNFFYFSYDDSASTASIELVKYKLNNSTKPSSDLGRPWEFLNYAYYRQILGQVLLCFLHIRAPSMCIALAPLQEPQFG